MKHPFCVTSLENTKRGFKLNAQDYFFKTALLLFGFQAWFLEPITCFMLFYAAQTWAAGLFEKASDEAQQRNPPAFMLGCRRELNTEGLEGRAGCSEECWGLAKRTAQLWLPLWRTKALNSVCLTACTKDSLTCNMLFILTLTPFLSRINAFIKLLKEMNRQS